MLGGARFVLFVAAFAAGCGAAASEPVLVEGPGDAPCEYRRYADISNELSASTPSPDGSREDTPVDLYDRVGWALRVTDTDLLTLDQIRATCSVALPEQLGARRLRRELERVDTEMAEQLRARTALIHPSEHERLETPLFTETITRAARERLALVTTAIALARRHRSRVLAASTTDHCTVERVSELEWWHDRVVELERAGDTEAAMQARDIASAVAWATPDVDATFRDAHRLGARVDSRELTRRRQTAIELLSRCPEPAPVELMPD